MQNLTQQLRRIEKGLEMLGVKGADLTEKQRARQALLQKLKTAYENSITLNLRTMEDEEITCEEDFPIIQAKIGKADAKLFYGPKIAADPLCVILCSTGAYHCDCSPDNLVNIVAHAYAENINIESVRLAGKYIFVTPNTPEPAPEIRVDTEAPYN